MAYVKTVVVQGTIHGRPAAAIVREANRYQSSMTLLADNRSVDAKSVIGIITLALRPGTSVEVCASGPDEREAVERVVEMLQSLDATD